jgi:hypothetical protein
LNLIPKQHVKGNWNTKRIPCSGYGASSLKAKELDNTNESNRKIQGAAEKRAIIKPIIDSNTVFM